MQVIVYFLTCACVDYFADALARLPALRGLSLTALHGRLKQSARERAMAAFSAAPGGALLCTDVAARGLDIPGVDWVLQYDPPQDPDAFVHRCGRTARMGAAGAALLLLAPAEETYLEFLRRRGAALTPAPPPDGDGDGDGDGAAEPDAFANAGEGALAALRSAAEQERELMEKARCICVALLLLERRILIDANISPGPSRGLVLSCRTCAATRSTSAASYSASRS